MAVALAAFFFFNDTATTEIYTLSLHDALPIALVLALLLMALAPWAFEKAFGPQWREAGLDRKSTRLNSSHQITSYAVFCLKKKTRAPHRPIFSAMVCSSSSAPPGLVHRRRT